VGGDIALRKAALELLPFHERVKPEGMIMEQDPRKPKLLFFQYRYGKDSPEFVVMHRRHQVKCLSEFFNVVLIQEDCDYRSVCDRHEPDLALFEMLSGAEILNARRPAIANAGACRDIPKLAFLNADAWCDARAGFISDMEHMGIDTAFSICATAVEHNPELADKLFVWPNFIDPEVYRDYGQTKVVSAYFTGAMSTLYPWRRKVQRIVADHYPSLLSPHHGYVRRPRVGQMMYGEAYARAINASWFVPACGTVAKDVLRKHFEIPGCKACLVTEQSAALESAGFVDMRNCVFADEATVLDKLAHLLEHQEELIGIIQAGYELVHSHHTLRQRDQILQWFHLNRKLRAGEKIVQPNPFGRLAVMDRSSGSNHLTGQGLHLAFLQQGDAALWAGDYAGAGALYRRSSNYIPWMPEPHLRLALFSLHVGDAKSAYDRIAELIRYVTVEYRAADPDPVEWAYLIVSLLCMGKLNEASQRASQFPALRHVELDHARWAVEALKTGGDAIPLPQGGNGIYRRSIHQMPRRSLKDWIERLCVVLKACKQPQFSAVLMQARSLPQNGHGNSGPQRRAAAQPKGSVRRRPFPPTHKNATLFITGLQLRHRLHSQFRRRVGRLLHYAEGKCGHFLPYHLSEMRNDEFFREVQKLARETRLRTALLVGAAKGKGITEAFLAGILENENEPAVFCLNGSTKEFASLESSFAGNRLVNCYGIRAGSTDEFLQEFEITAARIKKDHGLNGFDMVLIDGSWFAQQPGPSVELQRELSGATHILLDNIDTPFNHVSYQRLIRDPAFVLVACDPGLRNGYAIFERTRAYERGSLPDCAVSAARSASW
jgi:hypothetical protein